VPCSAFNRNVFAAGLKILLHRPMWNFIWHLRGSTPVPDEISDQDILDRIERLLDEQAKHRRVRDNQMVTFRSPLLGQISSNWLAMAIYDRGQIKITSTNNQRLVRYELRSWEAFIFCLGAAALFLIFGFGFNGTTQSIQFAAFAFGWLYGGNMVLAWVRIPRAIRRAVSER
jgi:hypothetical protein